MENLQQNYATPADLCTVFANEMDRLYLLAFLLLTSRALAERCFLRVLQAVQYDQTVFKSFAPAWVRRRIIKDALHSLLEESDPAEHNRDAWYEQSDSGMYIDGVTQMDLVERFVFVMSVLEGYSPKECSLLLGCSVQAVREAKTRALEALAMQSTSNVVANEHVLHARASGDRQ